MLLLFYGFVLSCACLAVSLEAGRFVVSTLPAQNQSVLKRNPRFTTDESDWSRNHLPHQKGPRRLRHDCEPGWFPIAFGCILLVLTWLANCTLLGGILQTLANPLVVPVAYYFVGSQAIAVLLHATLNLPPALVILLFGKFLSVWSTCQFFQSFSFSSISV